MTISAVSSLMQLPSSIVCKVERPMLPDKYPYERDEEAVSYLILVLRVTKSTTIEVPETHLI